jgi:hypothetical protein
MKLNIFPIYIEKSRLSTFWSILSRPPLHVWFVISRTTLSPWSLTRAAYLTDLCFCVVCYDIYWNYRKIGRCQISKISEICFEPVKNLKPESSYGWLWVDYWWCVRG